MPGTDSPGQTNPGDQPRIGILSPLAAGGYTSNLIAGVVAAASATGTRVVAIQTLDLAFDPPEQRLKRSHQAGSADGDHLGWPPGTEALVPHFTVRPAWDQVSGFLVVLNAVEPWYLQALREAGKPVIMLSHEVEGFACPVVRADNRSGIVQAVDHLVAHGHRRIAFAGCLVQTDITERLGGYLKALAAHGIEADPDLVFAATDNLEDGGEVAARAMLAAGMPSTAVVAATDYNALGIMRSLRKAGLVLPRDQALVGFDDVPAASSAQPTLSTVHQSFEGISQVATTLLLEMIHGTDVSNRSYLVPTAFVPRESCGCTAATTLSERDASGSPEDGLARDRLLHRLERLLVEGEATTVHQASALERAVDAIGRGLDVGAGAHDAVPADLAEAAAALHSVNPRWTTIGAVVACLQQYQRDLGKRAARGQSAARFQSGITEMAVELSRCVTQAATTTKAGLYQTMALDHELSVSLLSGTAGDPKSLGWLASTPARAGCLGMWGAEASGNQGGDGRTLTIAGSYLRGGGKLDLPAHSRMEAFPPGGLLDSAEWRPGELAIIFPIKTATLDLGLLAVVTPLTPAAEFERDRLFEHSALLSVALERQVMTERLRRTNTDLSTFSHAMAHDLRNPLATIAMWTSVARMRAGPGDDAGPVLQVVDQIKGVADDATELVSDLLQYAELDRGDAGVETVDLNLAAARVAATIGSSIAQQGAVIETGKLPSVPGRPTQLQLVLQNLIENAIKYRSDQPPRIRLDALRDGEVWKIRCRDNGQGIPGSAREGIFEPFTRGQTSVPGSGLGLATCRRIVEGHGGRIWIASSGNLGTTVAFTLPVGPERGPGEAEATPAPAAQSEPGDGTPPRQARDAA